MMALYGLFFYGPASHLWYTRLDSHIPGATLTIVFKKLMFDEMIGSPIFFFLFFAGLCNIFQPVLSVQIKFVYMYFFLQELDCSRANRGSRSKMKWNTSFFVSTRFQTIESVKVDHVA